MRRTVLVALCVAAGCEPATPAETGAWTPPTASSPDPSPTADTGRPDATPADTGGADSAAADIDCAAPTAVPSIHVSASTTASDLASVCAGGAVVVEGNLMVRDSRLEDLSGLECVCGVDGDLVVREGDHLVSLTGLERVAWVGGRLHVRDESALEHLRGLDGLREVGGDVLFMSLPELVDLAGLEALVSVGGDLQLRYLDRVSDGSGLSGLRTLGGTLFLKELPLSDLRPLDGLTFVEEVVLRDVGGYTSVVQGLDGVEALGRGGLQVEHSGRFTLEGLRAVRTCAGSVHIDGSSGATVDDGLTALEQAGTVYVASFGGTATVTGLASLVEVERGLWVSGAPDTTGLDAVRRVGLKVVVGNPGHLGALEEAGEVQLWGWSYANLDGLGLLRSTELLYLGYPEADDLSGADSLQVVGQLELEQGRVGSLAGLPALDWLGTLRIDGTAVGSLTGLEDIEHLHGDLALYDVSELTTLDGLEGLRQIDGDLRIYNALALEDLSALLGLRRIQGDMVFRDLTQVPPDHLDAVVAALSPIVDGDVTVE